MKLTPENQAIVEEFKKEAAKTYLVDIEWQYLKDWLTNLLLKQQEEKEKAVQEERERIAALCYLADTVEDVYHMIYQDQ